jgi:carboxyl-terminal processing protease
MIRHRNFITGILLLGFGATLLTLPHAGTAATEPASTRTTAATSAATATATNSGAVKPGPDDGRIAFLTAFLLEKIHFSRHTFDEETSSKFLDQYIESLDPQRLYFLQPDLAQFERYRTNLETMTITRTGVADVTPAFEIFSKFIERLQQRVAYADDLLKNDKFDFNTDERVTIDRRDSAPPKDLAEAKALWRQRLRYEYLQEKLGMNNKEIKLAVTNSVTKKVEPPKSAHAQIVETLTRRYHRNLRLFTDWDNEDIRSAYLTALAHVYDPHSDYFNKAQMDQFSIAMNLELFGIGAELRMDEEGYCKIERLLPGPAAKSKKVHEGDRIVAVAQTNQAPVDVVEMSLPKVVQLIRGPKGTEVRLTILPAGETERTQISLIRDEIQLDDQAAKGKIIEVPDNKGGNVRLGVIDLPSFYATMDPGRPKPVELATGRDPAGGAESSVRSTSADVAKLLTKFKEENVSGVILDLRRNGGGSLPEAVKLTGLFIKEGPVVQVKELNEAVDVDGDYDSQMLYGGPLIVLTSRFSASASEIVAGALQDYNRAVIVGDLMTHGKGTVQSYNSLTNFVRSTEFSAGDPGALKFTVRKFYRATGVSTQLQGVMPDIVLPSKLNYAKNIGEKALENSLQPDTIKSAKFDKLNLVQPYLSQLLSRSAQRVATNQDFAYVREDIEQFRKLQDEKTISLNEKDRLSEKQENDARQKVRDAEIRSRPEPKETVYDITLKQAGMPGLPAPTVNTNSLAFAKTQVSVSLSLDKAQPLIGTNSAPLTALKPAEVPALEDDTDGDTALKVPDIDVDLIEARRILMDYISLQAASRAGTASVNNSRN